MPMRTSFFLPLGCAIALACSHEPQASSRLGADAESADASGDRPALLDASGPVSVRPVPPGTEIPTIPTDFEPAQLGGYKLGEPITPELAAAELNRGRADPAACSVLIGVVRDFAAAASAGGHPDFEAFDGKKPTLGLVAEVLGADRKPVYASRCEANHDKTLCPYGQMTTGRAQFDSWYRSATGVNLAYLVYLAFAANGPVYTFESKAFFPLDGAGFGNMGGKKKHNFGFTTELHASFRYRGGETFRFSGDDDVWVYINGKLALDLGGLHPPASAEVDLDTLAGELDLEPGNSYSLDLFHAERHSAASNFRVDTTIEFTDCGQITPELI